MAIIEKLMVKKPDDRYQSAGEVVEVLSRAYEIACKSAECSGLSLVSGTQSVAAAKIVRGASGWWRMVATAVLPIAVFCAVFIIRTNKGEFVLTTEDPPLQLRLMPRADWL